jgi:Pyruvate/2-oxoacid:ferredoxin oxidoreductase delta subunit/DNA-binding Lrp family transcriptional regulator
MTTETDDYYRKIRDTLFMPKVKDSLTLLKFWFSPEEAGIISIFKMPMMDSYSLEKLAKKVNLPEQKLQEIVTRLEKKGLLFNFVNKKDNNKLYYAIPFLFPGLFEWYFASNISLDEKREGAKIFQRLDSEVFSDFASNYEISRVVPAIKGEKLIQLDQDVEQGKSQILLFEDVRKILENSWAIAVMPCPCRIYHGILGDACDRPIDVCINLNSVAEYIDRVGIGRKITLDEAIQILEKAEKAGLVHIANNQSDKHSFICNCCPDCCGFLSLYNKLKFLKGAVAKSNFIPRVEQSLCSKCKKCMTICPVNAAFIKYGSKEDLSDAKVIIREDICIGCGICASNCPKEAIKLVKVRTGPELEAQLWKAGMRNRQERIY